MQLLTVTINDVPHYAVHDPQSGEIVEFGPGVTGLREAVEFLNQVWLAEHAAEMAGYCF